MTLRDRLTRGGLWVFASQLIVQAMSVLVTVILARYLGATPKDSAILLGKYFLFTTLAAVLAQLAALGLHVALPKMIAEVKAVRSGGLERVMANGLAVTLTSGVVISVGYLLLADTIALQIYGDAELATLLRLSAPAIAFAAVGVFALSVLQGLQRIREYSLLAIAFSILSVPITWVLVVHHRALLLPSGIVGAAIASIALTALQALGVLWVARRAARDEKARLRVRPDRDGARALLGLSTPVFLSTLVVRGALLYQTSVIFLVLGDLLTGVWKITSAFYRILLFFPAALAIPMLPAMSELYARANPWERRRKVTELLRMTMVIALPASLLAGLGSLYMMDFLFGRTYVSNESVYTAFLLSTAAFFDSLTLVILGLLQASGRTRTAFGIDAFQATLLVILTFALITPGLGLVGASGLGLVGAAVATLASACGVLLVAVGHLARRGEVDLGSVAEFLGVAVVTLGLAGFALVRFLGRPEFPLVAAACVVGLFAVGSRFLRPQDRQHLRHVLGFLRLRNDRRVALAEIPPEPGRR